MTLDLIIGAVYAIAVTVAVRTMLIRLEQRILRAMRESQPSQSTSAVSSTGWTQYTPGIKR